MLSAASVVHRWTMYVDGGAGWDPCGPSIGTQETRTMAKVALKYRLTQAQLRSLTMAQRPELGHAGKVVMVPNETGKPYRFGDATPGAPVGFGFYVGPTGVFMSCAPARGCSAAVGPRLRRRADVEPCARTGRDAAPLHPPDRAGSEGDGAH